MRSPVYEKLGARGISPLRIDRRKFGRTGVEDPVGLHPVRLSSGGLAKGGSVKARQTDADRGESYTSQTDLVRRKIGRMSGMSWTGGTGHSEGENASERGWIWI
jgi:hypothetical protein